MLCWLWCTFYSLPNMDIDLILPLGCSMSFSSSFWNYIWNLNHISINVLKVWTIDGKTKLDTALSAQSVLIKYSVTSIHIIPCPWIVVLSLKWPLTTASLQHFIKQFSALSPADGHVHFRIARLQCNTNLSTFFSALSLTYWVCTIRPF